MNRHRTIRDKDKLEKLETIFFEALDQPDDQRAAYLDRVCGDDDQLLAAAEALLSADQDDTGLIDTAPWSPQQVGRQLASNEDIESDPLARPGSRIGRYRLVEFLGAGGMGSVWLAERTDDEFNQRVALKLIKRGLDTDEVLRRFRWERQVLAQLEHPNIARLIDGGATEDGRPYLVMEYIAGRPLDVWCDEHHLSIPDRLRLFLAVCEAVRYAHSKLTVHRDLKPGNILIAIDGQPKLLDFGLAKLLHEDGSPDSQRFTTTGLRMLTPRYASPEQVRGEPVSTASDVYSLGVVLYELLAGRSPYHLETGARLEIERAVLDQEVQRPSVTVENAEAGGGLDPRRIRARLRGDVDRIVVKALQKDPARRYSSVEHLADDIDRHLRSLPISAAPDSLAYRASRFGRRNKGLVAGAATAVAALIAATVIATTFALGEAKARQEAQAQSRLAAEKAEEAEQQAVIAEAINEFLTEDLLAAVAPSVAAGRGRDVKMREVLDAASARIETASQTGGRFADNPLVEAEIREALGNAYAALAEFEPGARHLARALSLRESELGLDHPLTLGATADLADVLCRRGRLEEAEPMIRQAVGRSRAVLGDDDPRTLAAIRLLGSWLQRMGRYEEARENFLIAYDRCKDILGPDHPDTLASASAMGTFLQARGEFEQATQYVRDALDGRRQRYGEDSPEALSSLHDLGCLLVQTGQYEDALSHLRAALAGHRKVCGVDHTDTLNSEHDVGDLLKKMGRYEEALSHYQTAFAGRQKVLGESHPETLKSMQGVASVLEYLGRYAEAEPYARRSLKALRDRFGDDHPDTLDALGTLGGLLVSMDRPADAEPMIRESAERMRRVLGPDHPSTLNSLNNLAAVLRKMRRFDEAEPLVRETLERRRRTLGEDHPSTLYSLNTLGALLINMRRFEEAEPYVRETYERRGEVLGPEHPSTLTARMNLAALLDFSGHLEASLDHHLSILDSRQRVLGPDHASTLLSRSVVASLLLKLGRAEEAEKYAADAVAGARRSWPEGHEMIGRYLGTQGQILTELGRFTEAEDAFVEALESLESSVGIDHKRYQRAVQGIVELYQTWHKVAPNEGLDAKAAEWRAQLVE